MSVVASAVRPSQSGMLLSIRTTFTPCSIALSSAGATVGSTGVSAMPCTPLVTIDSISAICPSMSVADAPWPKTISTPGLAAA